MTKIIFATTIFITWCVIGCNSIKKIPPSAIGVVTLHNYVLRPDVAFTDDIKHAFFANENDFRKMFTMTRTSEGSAIVPDFSTQSVVAIILKPTEKVVTINIRKAEIAGDELNIFYSVTDTTSFKNYMHAPFAVAAVPKSTSVKKVSFYTGNAKTTITASY